MGGTAIILAAGAVIACEDPRDAPSEEVLLVHRPKYDDWSFPKGKRDPGEHLATTAVREVAEETGLAIRLGPPLSLQRYEIGNGQPRAKEVHYWTGQVVGGDDVSTYLPNSEIDEVVWLPLDEARTRLTYPHDLDTLAEFEAVRKKTCPLVVLRHGGLQVEHVVPLLRAYGVDAELPDALSEQNATPDSVRALVHRLLSLEEPTALCAHRSVLPWVFAALALKERTLEPGGLFVAHHRGSNVAAVEQHDPPSR